jgi:hypothetical protein
MRILSAEVDAAGPPRSRYLRYESQSHSGGCDPAEPGSGTLTRTTDSATSVIGELDGTGTSIRGAAAARDGAGGMTTTAGAASRAETITRESHIGFILPPSFTRR